MDESRQVENLQGDGNDETETSPTEDTPKETDEVLSNAEQKRLFNQVYAFLHKNEYPTGASKNEKRALRQRAKPFRVENAVLMHVGQRGQLCRVVTDIEERHQIVTHLHAGLGGGHFGQTTTKRKLAERFWWPGATTDITTFIRGCGPCQKSNPSNKAPASSLHPIAVRDMFHRWGIDLVGPLQETPRGNKYLVVATEYMSKWAEAKAIPTKTAAEVHEFLCDLVCRFGSCHVILHDQGREFNNRLVEGLLKQLSITAAMSSAYHPQTNGLTERFNQTLVRHLIKDVGFVGSRPDAEMADIGPDAASDWDLRLQSTLFAYRCSRQSSTKHSPFYLMYGVQPKVPLEMIGVGDTEDDMPTEEEICQRTDFIADVFARTRCDALYNIKQAQDIQKQRYDLKHSTPDYKAGDLVLKMDRRRDTRMGDKLKPAYTGPYTIETSMGKNVYQLRQGNTILKKTVNAINLKKFCPPTSPSLTVAKKTHSELETLAITPLNGKSHTSPRLTPRKKSKSPPHSTTPNTRDLENMWVPDLNLTMADKEILLTEGSWLSDHHADAANALVARLLGNPHQTTLMAQAEGGFSPVATETVQILYDNNHWVATGLVGKSVILADSLNQKISENLARQLCQLYKRRITTSGNLHIKVIPCQKQKDSSSCGVYAAANAFEIASGSSQLNVDFGSPSDMREHLAACFSNGVIMPFPKIPIVKRGRKPLPRELILPQAKL